MLVRPLTAQGCANECLLRTALVLARHKNAKTVTKHMREAGDTGWLLDGKTKR